MTPPAGTPPRPTQLPLELPHSASFDEDDFFVTSSNEAVFDAISAWPDWPAGALALVGPPGSGKSHLAAIWRDMASARTIACAELGADAVLSLDRVEAILIEDAPSDPLDERALFHLLNLTRETGGSLLMTSAMSPASWTVALPDLATRLRGLPVVELAAPDEALLRAVLVKLFADRQVAVDEALVTYLLARTERSLAALRDLVERLDRAALAEHARITRAFAARVLRHPEDEEEH